MVEPERDRMTPSASVQTDLKIESPSLVEFALTRIARLRPGATPSRRFRAGHAPLAQRFMKALAWVRCSDLEPAR